MAYKDSDFTDWIDAADSNWGNVKDEYEEARKYFENEQTPSDVPEDKEYVQYNLITDLVRRKAGEVVSGQITPILLGGGESKLARRELFLDILDESKFQQYVLPSLVNYFYNEGLGAIKFAPNPFKRSKYGIGAPTIYFLRPDEVRLDPNSRDGMHFDDIYRIHAKRIPLETAKGHPTWINKDKITASMELDTQRSGEITQIQFCDLYEIEYYQTEYSRDENGNRIEEDIWYRVKYINKVVQVEAPVKTGYPVCRIIPAIHTPRTLVDKGRYPFGIYALIGQNQDQLNVVESVMLDAVKASIKNFVTGKGVNPEDEGKVRDQLARTNGVYFTSNPQADIRVIPGNPITPALVQWADRTRFRFDEQTGSSGSQRGQEVGQLSGRAINSLQAAGSIPELTAKANLENALTDLGVCIATYIERNMSKQQFSIFRDIDGNEREIRFNQMPDVGFEPDEYNMVEAKGGLINPLAGIGNMGVRMHVEMNQVQQKDYKLNLALLMRARADLSLMDVMREVYPDSWKDKMQNVMKEQSVTALIQDIANTDPEFLNAVSEQWQQVKQQLQSRGLVKTNGR